MRNKYLLISPIFGVLCAGIIVWALTKSVGSDPVRLTIFAVALLVLSIWTAVDGFKQYLNSYHNPDA